MKRLLIASLILFPAMAFATGQIGDTLTFRGKTDGICSTPLEQYFLKRGNRPKWLTETNTACWRGYDAYWEVRNSRLYLLKVTRDHYDPKEPDGMKWVDITERLFPRVGLPIFASWFSGTIREPQGEMLEYVHMGFESIFEKDLFLEFEDGVLVRARVVNNIPNPPPFVRMK